MKDCKVPFFLNPAPWLYAPAVDAKERLIKYKLSEILKNRVTGSKGSMGNIFHNRDNNFDADPSWISDGIIPGWEYYYLSGLSGDFNSYEEQSWENTGCHAAIWLEAIRLGLYDDYPGISEEKLNEYKDSFYVDDPAEMDTVLEPVLDAFKSIKEGTWNNNSEVLGFLKGLSGLFSDYFTKEFLLDNLTEFCECIVDSCADYPIRCIVLRSREVYFYKQYRENVPEEVRQGIDNALEIFFDPFCGYWDAITEDRNGYTSVVYSVCDYDEGGPTTSDLHPLYDYVLHYLIDYLPVLRETYGGALKGTSVISI